MEIKDPKIWLAFSKYCEWLSLPRHYSGLTSEQLEEKGFPIELVELLQLKYKKDFSSHFQVGPEILKEWDKHPELRGRVKQNWKSWCKCLTPGVMGKFYEKLMEDADPGRMKIWMEHVEEEDKSDNTVNLNIGFENILKSMREDGDLKPTEGKKDVEQI